MGVSGRVVGKSLGCPVETWWSVWHHHAGGSRGASASLAEEPSGPVVEASAFIHSETLSERPVDQTDHRVDFEDSLLTSISADTSRVVAVWWRPVSPSLTALSIA
jgi:hypothetical protein